MRYRLAVLCLLCCTTPETAHGQRLLDAYFHRQVQQIADATLAGVETRAGREKNRPEYPGRP